MRVLVGAKLSLTKEVHLDLDFTWWQFRIFNIFSLAFNNRFWFYTPKLRINALPLTIIILFLNHFHQGHSCSKTSLRLWIFSENSSLDNSITCLLKYSLPRLSYSDIRLVFQSSLVFGTRKLILIITSGRLLSEVENSGTDFQIFNTLRVKLSCIKYY